MKFRNKFSINHFDGFWRLRCVQTKNVHALLKFQNSYLTSVFITYSAKDIITDNLAIKTFKFLGKCFSHITVSYNSNGLSFNFGSSILFSFPNTTSDLAIDTIKVI